MDTLKLFGVTNEVQNEP